MLFENIRALKPQRRSRVDADVPDRNHKRAFYRDCQPRSIISCSNAIPILKVVFAKLYRVKDDKSVGL
jgi:hypothetical protein